jgi:hypothetical protein
MSDVTKRIEELAKYKERMKHQRGKHNQLDHNRWPDDYVAQGYVPVGRGGGGGIPNDLVLGNRRSVVLGNRKKPKPSDQIVPASTSQAKRLRPERSAAIPIDHKVISDPGRRRNVAIQQQAEWRRRHRMTQSTHESQGLVSPSAMMATSIEPRYGEFQYDLENTNLFENPTLIAGVGPKKEKTNQLDYHEQQIDKVSTLLERYLQDIVDTGKTSEDNASHDFVSLLTSEQIIRQAVMRKAAASYAMDIQGFVGGEVYSTDSPEFQSAVQLAIEANQAISLQSAIIRRISQRLAQTNGIDDEQKQFFDDLHDSLIHKPYESWTELQMQNSGMSFPETARLARVNPTLAADSYERMVEQSSGAVVQYGQNASDRSLIGSDISPNVASNSDKLTMSLPALMSFLHPSIQAQIKRLMQGEIKYPQNENPSAVISSLPGYEPQPTAKNAIEIASNIIDNVHSDGGLSDVSITGLIEEDEDSIGFYTTDSLTMRYSGLPDTGKPMIVLNNPETKFGDLPFPAIGHVSTIAHEFGHHIDATALTYAVDYWRNIQKIGSRSAMLSNEIGHSGAVPPKYADKAAMAPHILSILDTYRRTVQSGNQAMISRLPGHAQQNMQDFMSYLNQPNEVFARLYEQYIISKLRSRLAVGGEVKGITQADTAKAIDSINQHIAKRQGDTKKNAIQYFFSDADMAVVEKELEGLFSIMGWKLK